MCRHMHVQSQTSPEKACSLEPLGHHQNIANLSLFCRYYFGRCSSKLADILHDFYVIIPRCYKDVYVNSFFPHIAKLQNSLPVECFPLTYNLSGFKSRINRHLLTLGFF